MHVVNAESVSAAERWLAAWTVDNPEGVVIAAPAASTWPFRYPLAPELPAAAVVLRADGVDDAFINQQTGTQLVTTQQLYLEQEWSAALAKHGRAWLLTTPGTAPLPLHPLAAAFRLADPADRLRQCVKALAGGRTPAALVAAASVCVEVNDFDAAARDLDEALELAPGWAAAHYERGKLWLRVDDMHQASVAFQKAAELLPGFGPVWSNLGATLGELDRPQEALAAFENALALDPANPQALNNVGVVRRELGRLAESEAAFRQVIQLTPALAFGHYNLGHTLFLQGRFQAALSAYADGQARDPEKNPVQASRLAVCKLATGDGDGALRDLQRATHGLPRDYRQQLLAEISAIVWAVVTQRPDVQGWQAVQGWLTAELGTSPRP
jgi:tetratricopeptide (TPR) repeat protein